MSWREILFSAMAGRGYSLSNNNILNGNKSTGNTGVNVDDSGTGTLHGAYIKTGTYTGDGAVSQAITGVGFRPKYVKIVPHFAVDTTYSGTGPWSVLKTDTMDTQFSEANWGVGAGIRDNMIISLDADGFTVDDDGSDNDPNKNGRVYDYIVMGY